MSLKSRRRCQSIRWPRLLLLFAGVSLFLANQIARLFYVEPLALATLLYATCHHTSTFKQHLAYVNNNSSGPVLQLQPEFSLLQSLIAAQNNVAVEPDCHKQNLSDNISNFLQSPSWLYAIAPYAGFFSVFNNALNAVFLSWVHNIPCHFIIMDKNDPYSWAFRKFLVEPFSTGEVPLYLFPSSREHGEAIMLDENITLKQFLRREQQTETGASFWADPKSTGQHRTILTRNKNNWALLRHAGMMMEWCMETDLYFQLKTKITQRLWKLSPDVQRVTAVLQDELKRHSSPTGAFLAVHLRKGDKLSDSEMKTISNSAYIEMLDSILQQPINIKAYPNGSIVPVFILSDDDRSANSLIADFDAIGSVRMRNLTVIGYTWIDLFRKAYLTNPDAFRRLHIQYHRALHVHHNLGGGNGGYRQTARVERRNRVLDADLHLTHELITAVSLAANASHYIGTFSSNLSRFVALLRGELHTSYSLDIEWHGS